MKRLVASLTLGALAAGLATGCSAGIRQPSIYRMTAATEMSASLSNPAPTALTIGIKYDQPGLSVMGPDGTPHGFEIDVAEYVAKKLGVPANRIAWRETMSGHREDMLNSGAVDFVVASYSMNAQRRSAVSFAGPYLVTGQDLLVRADNTDITKPESLNNKTVCTAAGSASADKIKKDFAQRVKLTEMPTYSACVDAVLAHRADAVTTDDIVLAGYAAQHPGQLRVVGHPFTREHWGIGLKKGDVAQQAKITAAIEDMITDGSWQQAMQTEIAPSGYRAMPPPSVFAAPDRPTNGARSGATDVRLVSTVNAMAATYNAGDWDRFDAMVSPPERRPIAKLIHQYTPVYDTNLGPEVHTVGFTDTITGISQTGPDCGTFQAHEQFTDVPDKYKSYFNDINYTGTMVKANGEWQLRDLSADFIEN